MTNCSEIQMMPFKPIKVLVMSVGEFANNWTVRYLRRIGTPSENFVVCLPKQYEHNAQTYEAHGVDVYVYDESKYINGGFEFFGFKPRNCGGVGRQGIAEAVEHFGSRFLCFQMDDDYTSFSVYSKKVGRNRRIRKFENLAKMIYAFDEFYRVLGIDVAARTGATPPKGRFVTNRKIFNNFVMHPGNSLNFEGFAALCSDDQRFNLYRNILQGVPMLSTTHFSVLFHQNQGDRKDGNAVLYNSDCSWKKSFALKMMMPWGIAQYAKAEKNRALFREHIECSKLYPPIMFEDKGRIIAHI